MRKNWMLNLSYPPTLKIVLDSLYHIHLESYLDQFNNQIQIIDNNDLRSDPYNTLERLTKFLGLESYYEKTMFIKPMASPFFCTDQARMIDRRNDFYAEKFNSKVRRKIGKKLPLKCTSGMV